MKKIVRQLSSVRDPPTTGPAQDATAAPSDQTAMARARSRAFEYASRISANDAGTRAIVGPCGNSSPAKSPEG